MSAPAYSQSDHGVLELSNVIKTLRAALAAQPHSISSASEFLALICHASMLAVGFEYLPSSSSNSSSEDTAATTTEQQRTPPRIPDFSASATQFSFRYKHTQSALSPFLLSATKLGPKLIISALSEGNDEVTHLFEVRVAQLVSQAVSFPLTIPDADAGEGTAAEDGGLAAVSDALDPIALQAFITTFKKTIIQALVPNLQKDGYTEDRAASTSTSTTRETDSFNDLPPPPYPDSSSSSSSSRIPPSTNPDLAHPRVPRPFPRTPGTTAPPPLTTGPPGFEDEYEILNGPRGLSRDDRRDRDFRSPFSIGDDDLYPPGIGPHPSLTPGLTSPYGGGGGARGMYPSADHPLFAGRGSSGGTTSGVGGFRPPGARWDPPMDPAVEDPDMMMGGEGLRMPGMGGRRQGGGGGGFGFPGAGGFGGSGGFGGGGFI